MSVVTVGGDTIVADLLSYCLGSWLGNGGLSLDYIPRRLVVMVVVPDPELTEITS